jgi:hypothetical protein
MKFELTNSQITLICDIGLLKSDSDDFLFYLFFLMLWQVLQVYHIPPTSIFFFDIKAHSC